MNLIVEIRTFGLVAMFLWACGDGIAGPDAAPSGAPEVGAPDVGAPDVGAPDVGAPDVGAPDVGTPDVDASDARTPTGPGLFGAGCPEVGRARARFLAGGEDRLVGPAALSAAGDVVLVNDRAAFVIQGPPPASLRTYWYYPGGLIDAAPIRDCAQAAPEKFGELDLLIGRLDLQDFPQSVLRGFRGDRVEIIDDGATGEPARVRVHGRDDRFWLIELELIRRVVLGGDLKALSPPFGIDVYVDYVLPPDSAVLTISTHLVNPTAAPLALQVAVALFLADETENYGFTRSDLSLGGLNLGLQMPWLVAESREGSYALALETTNQATTNISGVDVLVDVNQALVGALRPAPNGGEAMSRMFVSVGATDARSAVGPLSEHLGHPTEAVLARARDAATGEPLAGVHLRAEAMDSAGRWERFDGAYTDDNGEALFDLWSPGPSTARRLVLNDAGRAPASPVEVPDGGGEIELRAERASILSLRAVDEAGTPMPVHLTLRAADGTLTDRWVVPGNVRLPPGAYALAVTRGYEYAPHRGELTLIPGETTALEVTLPRVLDTTGFISLDTHVHAAPSPDSRVPVSERAVNAAAVGLEVMISTDHEVVADWNPGIVSAGVGAFVRTFAGQEVTATTPEHTTMYPVTVDANARRGGPVLWYGLGLGEIFAAERARGAAIRGLNHPRGGCNWLCLIGWDRIAGAPANDDPTRFGLPEGVSVWSWDFEQVEYMNGHTPVFSDPERPDETGLFEDWMSFLNHGHRITAMGVTDTHGLDDLGSPLTWIRSETDDPALVSAEGMSAAVREGAAQVSTGALARVTLGDASPGDTVSLEGGQGSLKVRIDALPEVDVTEIKVFANCDQVASVAATAPDALVKFDGDVPLDLDRDAHVVVLALGSGRYGLGLPQFNPAGVPRVTTNALYVDADGDGLYTPPGGKNCTYTLPP